MKEELDRKHKVINMMITMHSIMYHRYKTKLLVGNMFFLISAIILNVFIFFDFDHLSFLDIKEEDIKNIVSLSSFTIFLLSVIFILVNWAKSSEKHKQSVNSLSRLLNELRTIQKIDNTTILISKSEMFNELYNQTFDTLPSIPHRKFNPLKSKHYQKIELSKFIDNNKGKPYFVTWILFYIHQVFTKK